jgi:hypothetical protein
MLKSIVGVVVGYLVMFFVAFAAYTAAYFGLGTDRIFETGTYAFSGMWIALVIAVTLISGFIGGLTCTAVSKSRAAGLVVALIAFVVSFAFELPNIMKDNTPVVRAGDVSNLEVLEKGQPPPWLCILNPFLAGAAVLMGTRMKKIPAA